MPRRGLCCNVSFQICAICHWHQLTWILLDLTLSGTARMPLSNYKVKYFKQVKIFLKHRQQNSLILFCMFWINIETNSYKQSYVWSSYSWGCWQYHIFFTLKRALRVTNITMKLCLSSSHFTDLLPSKGSTGLTNKFLQEVVDILLEYVQNTFDRSCKILDFHYPNELREKLHLEIPDKAENLDQILFDCRNTLKYCVTTGEFIAYS